MAGRKQRDLRRMIIARHGRAGWGAKVIDRLSSDPREAFPDMKGYSPRNLKYMRAFAAAWPGQAIVQEALARIPCDRQPEELHSSLPTIAENEAELSAPPPRNRRSRARKP